MLEVEINLGLIRKPYLNLLEYHKRKWRKQGEKDYSLIVIENGQMA
jgi:hypothetical protein